MSAMVNQQEWIGAVEATVITGTTRQHVAKLAELGYVAVRTFPGARPIYRRADLEKLASRVTIEPRAETMPAFEPTA